MIDLGTIKLGSVLKTFHPFRLTNENVQEAAHWVKEGWTKYAHITDEEVLDRAGFKKLNHYKSLYAKGKVRIRLSGGKAFAYTINKFNIIEVEYFHELQNWYYNFFGKELEINL